MFPCFQPGMLHTSCVACVACIPVSAMSRQAACTVTCKRACIVCCMAGGVTACSQQHASAALASALGLLTYICMQGADHRRKRVAAVLQASQGTAVVAEAIQPQHSRVWSGRSVCSMLQHACSRFEGQIVLPWTGLGVSALAGTRGFWNAPVHAVQLPSLSHRFHCRLAGARLFW